MSPVLDNELKKFLTALNLPSDTPCSTPPNPEMGDVAIPCFELAKKQGKNPALVASELARTAQGLIGGLVETVSSAGPFLNFTFNAGKVAQIVLGEIAQSGERFGSKHLENPANVLIEYPSNNTHKEFHIGHLRNVCIGNTLVKLFAKAGYGVTPVNYLNDFGAHVVKCLWGLRKFHGGETPPENKQRWLGQVYAEANNYLKDHPECQGEVDDLQLKLEARDPSVFALFEETRAWSLEGFKRLNAELAIEHARVFFESDLKDRGQQVVDELLAKGIATVGERGAIIADLSAYKLDTVLLRKSTGAGLYITSDLALAEEKFARYDITESICITGLEQNFQFKQLFKILELAGFNKKMTHVSYGLVMLPEGKMSSRAGTVILYEDLRDQVFERLKHEMTARHADWPEEKIQSTTLKLTLAVLKYNMQKHEAAKNIVFNLDEAVSFEGMSAPYILYSVARINSIFRKAQSETSSLENSNLDLLSAPTEKRLALMLSSFPDILEKAFLAYNPSVVAKYCFDLAQAFNDWYAQCPILGSEKALSKARLTLAGAVRTVLVTALDVLTIETVAEM